MRLARFPGIRPRWIRNQLANGEMVARMHIHEVLEECDVAARDRFCDVGPVLDGVVVRGFPAEVPAEARDGRRAPA